MALPAAKGAMRISAPGIFSMRHSRAQLGLTLIEMLAVMLVLGLLAGLIAANLPRPDGQALRPEAERLAALLAHASAEARLTGKRIAWDGRPAGYGFLRWSEADGWRDFPTDAVLRRRALPTGVLIEGMSGAPTDSDGQMRLEFVGDGLATAVEIRLAGGGMRMAVLLPPVGDARTTTLAN